MERRSSIMAKLGIRSLAALSGLIAAFFLSGAPANLYHRNQKAHYADPKVVAFVHPGLTIKINAATIAQDGTISVTFALTDGQGTSLDRTGISTPGAVSLNFIPAYLPQGQHQYVDYITRSATGAVSGTVSQAAAESSGTFATVGDGYRYTFSTRAASGFNAAATHTIGIYASRDLTQFDLGTNYASATFNFRPNGSPVTETHDVIRTQSCDRCHDQLDRKSTRLNS